jgi:hypothetical protein
MWRLCYLIPTWIIFLFVYLSLVMLGWLLVPIAAAFGSYNQTDLGSNKWHFNWPFMWLWDNDEDGIANDSYYKAPNMFLQILYWSAWRNPVNNLRYVPYLSCKINPARVWFTGSLLNIYSYDTPIPQWFIAWQGIYGCWYWQFRPLEHLYRLWIGWKIYPTDIYGVTEYRKRGAGFAIQFKRVA